MSLSLSPGDACRLADSSYATLGSRTPNVAAAAAAGASRELFDVDASTVFTGSTGAGEVSNFGYVAFGGGSRQGECLVSVRGTQTMADVLTDLYFAGARGPSGLPVHHGFNILANSILPQVRTALQGRNPSSIHLVGHSLGGAAAAILADALHGVAETRLYTFGAPRAGTFAHTEFLTSAVGPDNIFRVFHDTDPVPMVPIFPYTHAPSGRAGYLITGSGMIISPGAHSLTLYQSNVGNASWAGLPTIPHRRFSLDTVDDVLEMAGHIPGGYLSSLLMRLIVRALGMILSATGAVLGTGAYALATVIDQIAYILVRGLGALATAADHLRAVIVQILRFLGITAVRSVSLTVSFLRWLLQKLFTTISTMAVAALNAVG